MPSDDTLNYEMRTDCDIKPEGPKAPELYKPQTQPLLQKTETQALNPEQLNPKTFKPRNPTVSSLEPQTRHTDLNPDPVPEVPESPKLLDSQPIKNAMLKFELPKTRRRSITRAALQERYTKIYPKSCTCLRLPEKRMY